MHVTPFFQKHPKWFLQVSVYRNFFCEFFSLFFCYNYVILHISWKVPSISQIPTKFSCCWHCFVSIFFKILNLRKLKNPFTALPYRHPRICVLALTVLPSGTSEHQKAFFKDKLTFWLSLCFLSRFIIKCILLYEFNEIQKNLINSVAQCSFYIWISCSSEY